MSGRRMVRGRRAAPVRAGWWALLHDEPLPPGKTHTLERLLWPRYAGELWEAHGEAIVREWAVQHPGTRPRCWWHFSAPRMAPGDPWAKRLHLPPDAAAMHAQLREMVGGHGEPLAFRHEPPPIDRAESYFGMPRHWDKLTPRAPPRFESQAAYLRHHRLLLPGEAARLTRAHNEPEVLPREWWPARTFATISD